MIGRNTPKTDTHSGTNAQYTATIFQHPLTIKAYVPPIEMAYHYVTAEQIESYAEMGLWLQVFLTAFGILIGMAIGCWIALIQGQLSPVSYATLVTTKQFSAIFSLIALLFAGRSYYLQRKQRQGWITSTLPEA